MKGIKILHDRCNKCRICIKKCPVDAIEIKEEQIMVNNNCSYCGICEGVCKCEAIFINRSEDLHSDNIKDYTGVLVFGEQRNGELCNAVFELLGEGSRLAKALGVELSVVLLGNKVDSLVKHLAAFGADKIYVVDHPKLELYSDEIYSTVITDIVRKSKPEIFMVASTAYGSSLAPRIASRLGTGLTADCTDLEVDVEKRVLIQTRPAFGGNLMAKIICPNQRPQMCTIKPKVMKAIEPDYSRCAEIITPDVVIPDSVNVSVIDIVKDLKQKVNLSEADIVVSAGRGIQKPQNMEMIYDFANVLGASVGASRAVVDAGWIDYSYQVGQTGKTIRPKIYFACGISGAIQHLAGISSSRLIVSINKDPDAPIFKVSNLGIVGDLTKVIPAFIKEFEKFRCS